MMISDSGLLFWGHPVCVRWARFKSRGRGCHACSSAG